MGLNGAPHLGQKGARSETVAPQSGQLIMIRQFKCYTKFGQIIVLYCLSYNTLYAKMHDNAIFAAILIFFCRITKYQCKESQVQRFFKGKHLKEIKRVPIALH